MFRKSKPSIQNRMAGRKVPGTSRTLPPAKDVGLSRGDQVPGTLLQRSSNGAKATEYPLPPEWQHGLAGLGLALFVVVLFGRLLFTNRVLASGDILHYFIPYRDYAAAALQTGQLPLWNPYIFLGVPFLANPQAGVLYPLHWPLSWLAVTDQIYWSGALHCWILGMGGYALLRRWGYGATAALASGLVLAGSGFTGGLLGHINQLNGVAWLPWLVLVAAPAPDGRKTAGRVAAFAGLTALTLLAGHTQSAYINLFGVGIWIVLRGGMAVWPDLWAEGRRPAAHRWPRAWAIISTLFAHLAQPMLIAVVGTLLGALLSAAQLLPTLELSDLGLRSGGLSYGEVSSFSLKPLFLAWTLLPTYGWWDLGVVFSTLGYTEFVAYVGMMGLLLAGWGGWNRRDPLTVGVLLLAGSGLFLALGRWNPLYFVLYKVIPGFDLFRTPARWMMLYTLGMALLAGMGFSRLPWERLERRLGSGLGQLARIVLLALIGLDLVAASLALPHTHPTAPEAVYGVRTGPAHLLTDPVRTQVHPAAGGRFLSLSTLTFDPGDMADYRRIYREGPSPQLDEKAFAELVIAQKSQEILAPNLPLLWRIPAVDGFDGGVLPLQRFIQALTLFIPPESVVPDGRLREQVRQIPATVRLNLLNIQYVITDKVQDHWHEGIYYDRQIGAHLGDDGSPSLTVTVPLAFEATHIALLGKLDETAYPPELAHTVLPVAQLLVRSEAEESQTLTLTGGGGSGAHFADSNLDSPLGVSAGANVAYRDVEGGQQEYVALLALDRPATPQEIVVRHLPTAPGVRIQAMTLVDQRTGSFLPLLPSDRGHFALVHSGDVKIYENLDLLPRVYLVHRTTNVADAAAALTWLQANEGPLDGHSVVENGPALRGQSHSQDRADLLTYGPEAVVVQTVSQEPAYLVLSDSYYPGWTVTVDHAPATIYPTNALMRGVSVPAGEHTVSFRYQPDSWRWGLRLSALGFVIWLGLLFLSMVDPLPFLRSPLPQIEKEGQS